MTFKLIKINGSAADIVDNKISDFSILVPGKNKNIGQKRHRKMETVDTINIVGLQNF